MTSIGASELIGDRDAGNPAANHHNILSRAHPIDARRTFASYAGVTPPGRRLGKLADREYRVVRAVGARTSPSTPHTILKLCATPHPVAELAALLKMPLGVARVLLGDLAAAGSVTIHRTVSSADVASDVALMQRVLAGLHRL